MTVPWLYQGMHAGKKTGTLVFTRDTEEKKIYFSAGDIIFASSNVSEDWLGDWLVRAGTITRQQCDASSELVKTTGKKQGAILVELGFITPKILVDGVKQHVKQIVLGMFSWRSGSYLLDEGPLPASDIIPLQLSTGNLIIEGLRGLEWEVVRKSLPSLKTVILPTTDPYLLFQGVDLEQDQWTVFSLIDGARSIEEICCFSDMGDFNTLRALYVLLALQMIEKGNVKSAKDKEFVCEVVRETAAAEARTPAGLKAVETITREELQAAYDNLVRQNHYEILDVGRDTTPPELKKAYFHLAKLYHPDRHFRPEMADMKAQLETLFSAVHDAYETLIDQDKRKKYELGLASRTTPDRAQEPTPPAAAENKDLAAAQFNEGLKKFSTGDFWGAEEAFAWAMRLAPDNAEYVYQRGFTLSRMPRRGHEAEDHFMKAIEMAPNKIEYYLELGQFLMRSGLKAKALAIYQDALKRHPNSEKLRQAVKKADG